MRVQSVLSIRGYILIESVRARKSLISLAKDANVKGLPPVGLLASCTLRYVHMQRPCEEIVSGNVKIIIYLCIFKVGDLSWACNE